MRCNNLLALCASAVLLSACGGDDSSGGSIVLPDTPSTGVFIDSTVAGLHYQTATQSGTTNSAGEYNYLAGETVTFSIGGISLGSSMAGPIVTPLSLVFGAKDAMDPKVTNIVILLLTLDEDGDPGNGISISAATATAAQGQTVNFDATDLAMDPGMSKLLQALPSSPTLVDATVAQDHFTTTLTTTWGSMTWGDGKWISASLSQ